jgi:hypothetical protein
LLIEFITLQQQNRKSYENNSGVCFKDVQEISEAGISEIITSLLTVIFVTAAD